MVTRKIRLIQSPQPTRGFLGTGHTAVPVIGGGSFMDTDPFILLMDDQLDLPGTEPVGGPHPHAGFETVTLVLAGDPYSKDKTLQTGGLEWMTAGSGIVHTEEIRQSVKLRILQLWLVLPKAKRWIKPKWQELHLDNVPVKKEGNSEIRVYSGTSLGMQAPTQNETPTIVVDFNLEPGYEVLPELPAHYNGFIYVIEGNVIAGEDREVVRKGQVAWLDKSDDTGPGQARFIAGTAGARFVFYAGEPQGDEIVSHGPFIGDTVNDITRLYQDYRLGKMKHVKELPPEQIFRHEKPVM
jgi:redox-sensitive bicupin YhaK (pirin superfamily)